MLSERELENTVIAATELLGQAQAEAKDAFLHYPPTAKAALIAAYLQAMTSIYIGKKLGDIAEALTDIAPSLRNMAESVRSDHPLQGETFSDLSSALSAIADGTKEIADAIKGHEG